MLRKCFVRFAYAGCKDSDTPELRLQKAILVVIPTAISISCIFWSLAYYFFHKPLSASIPGSYAIFSTLSIAIFFRTKNYSIFRFSQIFLILWLPFLLQASLGGFRYGSAVQVWAMLAPISALMFHGVRPANYWLLAYLGMTVVSGLLESTFSIHVTPLPETVIDAFFVLNICIAFSIVFMSVQYYVTENSRILRVIRDQAKKLMELDQIKNRFFANISHEFRTPLALTLGPLEDALNGEYGNLGDKLTHQLQVMLRNSRRLLRLINQLLDISKLESGEMQLKLSNHDIRHYLKTVHQSFIPFAERKRISFEFDSKGGTLNAQYDKEKMDKVINNLLSNAFKFTPQDGRIKLSVKDVNQDELDYTEITVKDNGAGISIDNIGKVFDRFYQVDGSSTREHEGTGIGLSLVKELVELHHGTLELKSEPGFGSEFKVLLPHVQNIKKIDTSIEKDPDYQGNTHVELASIDSAPDFIVSSQTQLLNQSNSFPRVLVVDDNKDIRQYVSNCLLTSYQVFSACDGIQGLQQVKKHHPDLIISDIMMPGMDGYEFCRILKDNRDTQHIPLIFLTAKASNEMLIEGLNLGADDYLVKPFNSKELLARVKNLITLKQQEKALVELNSALEKKLKDQIEELIKTKRLSHYFSGNLLQRILSTEHTEEMITERRNITILFSDLCNFTEMTDRLEVEKATALLNEYLSEMAQIIEQHDATTIQIIGDGIMVFFGAPIAMESSEQAIKAIHLGIAMQKKVGQLSDALEKQGIDYVMRSRIGIHQDFVTVGNFGSRNLMEYTAVGRGVNLASRLESSCTPGNIKVSQTIYSLARDQFPFGPLQEEQFRGFNRIISVSELNPTSYL